MTTLAYRSPQDDRRRKAPRPRSPAEERAKLALLATAYVITGLIVPPNRSLPAEILLGLGVCVWLMAVVTMIYWRREKSFPGDRSWRRLTRVCLVTTIAAVPLTMLVFICTCPHGTRWANNLIGLNHGDPNGPCRNGLHGLNHAGDRWRLGNGWTVYWVSNW